MKLEDIPKKDIYSAPEGYFERLEKDIQTRIEGKPEGKVVSFYKHNRLGLIGLAAAASIALLIVFLPITNTEESMDVTSMLAEISTEDCLAYLEGSELTMEQIIGDATDEELEQALDDLVPAPEFDEGDLELLYEKFGATSDEKLNSL